MARPLLALTLLLAASVFPTTILTRADPASIDVALPILRSHFPDVRILNVEPVQWRAIIERGEADLLWAGAPVLYEALYREGYLAPMPDLPQIPEVAGGIRLKRVGPDGRVYYVIYALLGYVIGYNAEAVTKAGLRPVCSWRELASPELAKYYAATASRPIAIAKPTKSTSTAAMMQLVTEIYGWEEGWRYLTAMAAVARFVDSSGAVRDLVKRGEALLGPMVDYYVFLAGLDYCIPQDGTDVLYDPIAIPKGANMTKAKALLDIFLSKIARSTIDRYIIPGNLSLLDSPEVDQAKARLLKEHWSKLTRTKIVAVPPEKGASYYYSFVYYYEATLVDLQDLLTETWISLVKTREEGKITAAQFQQLWSILAAPLNYTDPATGRVRVFTYEDAVAINDAVARDPAYRDQLRQAWREAARARYLQVKKMLEAPTASTQWPLILTPLAVFLAALLFIALRRLKTSSSPGRPPET
ncbi:MAG: ABC transporter substrate-binding protein [Pyrobaculum sp.]